MPKLVSICRLDVTISARYDWSVARKLTSFPLRHWNLRNLTLQQECYLTSTRAFFRTVAWLYNAAASPASRLRSAVSLAIISSGIPCGNKLRKKRYDIFTCEDMISSHVKISMISLISSLSLKLYLRWFNRVMQDHEARASDLNRKLIFSLFLLFS